MPEISGDDSEVSKSARTVLAENLLKLKESKSPHYTQKEIGDAIGKNQTTIGRMVKAKHEARIDNLDGFGKLFKLQAWQLLVPGLDPQFPPEVTALSPKAAEVARLYDELSPHKQRLLFAQAQVLHNPDVDPDAALTLPD